MAEGVPPPPGTGTPAPGGENAGDKPPTLEARVAELEDKLAKLTVSEEEWKTYQKVTSVLSGQGGLPPSASCPTGFFPFPLWFPIVQNCTRCAVIQVWMMACVANSGSVGPGKPGADFGDLGRG